MVKIKAKLVIILRWLANPKGNVIAYIAMLLIIFGSIGGIMASLLTSSVTSSATPNHSRRAEYNQQHGDIGNDIAFWVRQPSEDYN